MLTRLSLEFSTVAKPSHSFPSLFSCCQLNWIKWPHVDKTKKLKMMKVRTTMLRNNTIIMERNDFFVWFFFYHLSFFICTWIHFSHGKIDEKLYSGVSIESFFFLVVVSLVGLLEATIKVCCANVTSSHRFLNVGFK